MTVAVPFDGLAYEDWRNRVDNIEITPAMIEAGKAVLDRRTLSTPPEVLIADIFRAMRTAED